jgi:hypothetical protein
MERVWGRVEFRKENSKEIREGRERVIVMI